MNRDIREQIKKELIFNKEATTLELLKNFERLGYTKQGFYKALRSLIKEEVVIKKGIQIRINLVWVKKEIETLSKLFERKDLLFEEGNKTIICSSLKELDMIYSQIFISSIEKLKAESKYMFLFYDLYNYTYLDQQNLVNWYVDILNKKGKSYLLVGSTSELSNKITKEMKNLRTYNIARKWNYYISVIGDVIIYNYIDKKVLRELERIFDLLSKEDATREFNKIYNQKGRFKIITKKDPKELQKINKYFSKYFVLD